MLGVMSITSPTFAHVGGGSAALTLVRMVRGGREKTLTAKRSRVGQHGSEHSSHPTLLHYAVNEHRVGVRDDDGMSVLSSLHCPKCRHGLVVNMQPARTKRLNLTTSDNYPSRTKTGNSLALALTSSCAVKCPLARRPRDEAGPAACSQTPATCTASRSSQPALSPSPRLPRARPMCPCCHPPACSRNQTRTMSSFPFSNMPRPPTNCVGVL